MYLLTTVIFLKLVVDVLKEFSPGKYWVIQVFLRDLSCYIEIRKSLIEIYVGGAVIALELVFLNLFFTVVLNSAELFDGFFDSVLEKEIVD